jgi:hypothetical protein
VVDRERKRAYNRRYYQENRERFLAKSKERYEANRLIKAQNASRRHKLLRAFIQEQKIGKACMACGFSNPRALDFHHRESAAKEINVSDIWQKGWSRRRILAEIAKCDVLCANCHRNLHAEEKDDV